MLSPGLSNFALMNDCKVGKRRIFGEYNGYYFTAFDGPRSKCFAIILQNVNETQKVKILETLNKNKDHLRLTEFDLKDGFLMAYFKEASRPLQQEEIENFLDYASNVLKEQEVSGAVKCIKCGAEGYHDMEIINDIPLFMCEDCKIKKPRI